MLTCCSFVWLSHYLFVKDICGAQEREFSVTSVSDGKTYNYQAQLGDETIIAPLSYFYPELFKITGNQSFVTQKPNEGDSEDPLDEHFLRDITVSVTMQIVFQSYV